jgi:hypothetical protein
MSEAFAKLVREIPQIGVDWHRETILANSRTNAPHIKNTMREIKPDSRDVIVVSAGPSLYRQNMLQRIKALGFTGALVAIDGSYVQCLRASITPNYVLTLDPHPTRIVRWFGDPEFADNSAGDDYFARQDLDEAFRRDAEKTNAENLALIDDCSRPPLLICSTAPANVVRRTADFERYWFAPLVDNPKLPGSLTREIAQATGLPCLNTGGTVGTAAVIFAHCILKARRIAVVGMDLGYAKDLPLERTQSWNMLKDRADVKDLYPKVLHPKWGECYVDPTYAWYRQNLLALLKSAGRTLYNCTEGGALYGPHVECMTLEEFARGPA